MRYLMAAALGLLLGALAGIAVGGGPDLISVYRDRSGDPSTKAASLASGISGALNCGALGAIAGIPMAIGVAYIRRKKR